MILSAVMEGETTGGPYIPQRLGCLSQPKLDVFHWTANLCEALQDNEKTLASSLISSVTMGKSFKLSMPQFFNLYNGMIISIMEQCFEDQMRSTVL